MIAKISKGGSFGGAVSYTMDEDGFENKEVTFLDAEGLTLEFLAFDEEEKKDVLEDGDIPLEICDESNEGDGSNESQETDTTLSPNESPSPLPMIQPIVEDFEAQASMNPKVEVPVRHFILSYSPQDLPVLTDKIMTRDAKEYLHKMGYSDTQYLIVRHSEKNNPHVHIVANAVDNNGRKIPDNFDRKKSVEICKEITLKNGYTLGEHKCVSNAQDIHNPIDKVKYDLSKKIVSGIEKCASITFLPEKLAQMGVECQLKTDNKGLPVGISFSVQAEDQNGKLREYKFAGSKIDRMFSAKNIAVACQLHQQMPGLVNCAYAMTMDYESDPKSFPEAKKEYEILKKVLSRECKARKRLEYEYKDSRKKGLKAVLLTLLFGPPFSVAIPAMYMAMRQSKFKHEYAEATRSIEATLKQVRAAQRIMKLINNPGNGYRTYPTFSKPKPEKQIQPDSDTQSQPQERNRMHHMKMH